MSYGLSAGWLMAAMGGVWLYPSRRFSWWSFLFLGWLAYALIIKHVTWAGAAGLGILALFAWGATVQHRWSAGRGRRWGFTTVALLLALCLASHLWPGFDNPKLISGARLSEDAAPFTLWLSFDKAAAGFLLLLFFYADPVRVARMRMPALRALLLAAGIAVVTIAVVLGLGTWAGMIRWEPKWLPFIPAFFMVNLMFTCLVEEVFFRSILQAGMQDFLQRIWPSRRRLASACAVLVCAALFAFAHIGAPPLMLLLIGLAGLGYGAAYALTQRLGAAVLVHVALNLAHLVFFTYPRLATPA